MSKPWRVLLFAGYTLPSQHRKVELLADAEDFEIVHIAGTDCGRAPGIQPSANGKRTYVLRTSKTFGPRNNAHYSFGWPPSYGMGRFKPHLIHYEGEVESLGAAQIVLLRWLLAHRSALILTTWQNILRPRKYIVRMINNLNMLAAQHVLCASEEAITVLRRQGYHGSCSVLPIVGLDTSVFYPKPMTELRAQLGLNGFVVGFVGRLTPEKGIDTLLRVVAKAHSSPSLLLIGSGTEKESLYALAEHLGIASRCRFIDAVAYSSVADYINILDMLVLPSLTTTHWKEQFGRVLVEAMACKVMVTGSDSGEIPQVIGNAGRLFPEGDVDALAAIIDEMASDPITCRAFGEQGYERALNRYSIERIATDTLAVWRTQLDLKTQCG